jgi:hypothetical protein
MKPCPVINPVKVVTTIGPPASNELFRTTYADVFTNDPELVEKRFTPT